MNYVLLNQGTPESKLAAIYLNRLADDDDEVHSLFLDFGLPNRAVAMAAAEKIAQNYCTSHAVMKAQMEVEGIKITPAYVNLFTLDYIPISLMKPDADKSKFSRILHYPLYRQKAILEAMAYARAVAKATKIVEVHGGIDTAKLIELNRVFNLLKPPVEPTEDIELILPFMGMELPDILESLGLKAKDIEDTVSCLETAPCGVCSRCLKMEELFDAENNSI